MTHYRSGRRTVAYRRGMALLVVIVAAMVIAWGVTVKSGKIWPEPPTETEKHR